MTNTLLEELHTGKFKEVWQGGTDWISASVYKTDSGRKVSIYDGLRKTINVNDIPVGFFYKKRILHAIKKGVKKQ